MPAKLDPPPSVVVATSLGWSPRADALRSVRRELGSLDGQAVLVDESGRTAAHADDLGAHHLSGTGRSTEVLR